MLRITIYIRGMIIYNGNLQYQHGHGTHFMLAINLIVKGDLHTYFCTHANSPWNTMLFSWKSVSQYDILERKDFLWKIGHVFVVLNKNNDACYLYIAAHKELTVS